MTSRRFNALGHAIKNTNKILPNREEKISSFFGCNVFSMDTMKEYLTPAAYNAVKSAIEGGKTIERKTADKVADGMMKWAMEKGATHYTHWFQPLRGSTAEKHDSFFQPDMNGGGIEKFRGELLVQQEPDASSFPNGGIRNTFEARGYTAWDPSSPAFIIEKAEGITLCIPTVFVSYTGEALDYKAPLLKSVNFMQNAATEICQYFDKNIKKTTVTLGVEQEYFLIDEDLYFSRPDLVLSGRTLVGDSPAKGQQLDDHYFGSIPDRIYAYMTDFETESHKLGIPLMTRHNEVAPGQFECAPMFEEVNLAVDHNSLLMDIMEKLAVKHRFKVLMHEKPFKGINGSGKHNNWSIGTDTGVNLLKPGEDPANNLQFLTFFINTIKAVYDHADLLRASIASAGNDHRLGANEAPPAIVSAFIGSTLTDVLNSFMKDKEHKGGAGDSTINVNRIPEIQRDDTDRNRTSPFAFTGNKFEFRAVGSDQNCASPMIVLNTIVGNQLMEFKKDVEALKADKMAEELAIKTVLRKYIKKSKKVLFEGNGYGQEWVEMAKKRGLSNIKTTPHALGSYVSKSSRKVFVSNGILTETELEARTEIRYENYTLKIQIEGRVLGELVNAHVIPAALKYQQKLVSNVKDLESIGMESSCKAQKEIIKNISKYIQNIYSLTKKMIEERKKANVMEDPKEQAIAYCENVATYFDEIRYNADRLERYVSDEDWPLPKYRELLFVR